MTFRQYETVKYITEERIRNHLQDAETKRLLRQIGKTRGSRLSRHVLNVLTTLGRLFVTFGRQLENLEISSADVSSDVQNPSQALPTG